MEASHKLAAAPDDPRPLILNLGCGAAIRTDNDNERWLNLDMYANPGVDVVANLEDGLPMFEDESLDAIFASHVLEHVKNWTQLIRECHRVLKPRGVLFIRVPEGRCRAAYADPTHCNYFAPETFLHFAANADIGFDTLGMRGLGFHYKWVETIIHPRPEIDCGTPGTYFTEIVVDLEKVGPAYPWEEEVERLTKEAQEGTCPA